MGKRDADWLRSCSFSQKSMERKIQSNPIQEDVDPHILPPALILCRPTWWHDSSFAKRWCRLQCAEDALFPAWTWRFILHNPTGRPEGHVTPNIKHGLNLWTEKPGEQVTVYNPHQQEGAVWTRNPSITHPFFLLRVTGVEPIPQVTTLSQWLTSKDTTMRCHIHTHTLH